MNNKKMIKQILRNIKLSESIYNQASKSVHSSVMQNQLSAIKQKRKEYFKELRRAATDKKNSPASFNLFHLTRKIWLKINDLLIHKNVPDILITCVETDRALLKSYQITNRHDLDSEISRLINEQKQEVKKQADEFQKRIDQYPWK